jgi:hypothetical protein
LIILIILGEVYDEYLLVKKSTNNSFKSEDSLLSKRKVYFQWAAKENAERTLP